MPDSVPSSLSGIQEQEAEWRAAEGERLLVVGVGASAGGLEAFERSCGGLPSETASRTSSRSTSIPSTRACSPRSSPARPAIPVEFAKDGQRIERDHVYVMPRDAACWSREGSCASTRRSQGQPAADQRLPEVARRGSARERRRDRALGHGLRRRARDRGRAAQRRDHVRPAPVRRPLREHAAGRDRDRHGGPGAPGRRDRRGHREPRRAAGGSIPARARAGSSRASGSCSTSSPPGDGHDFSQYKRSTVLRRVHRRMASTSTATAPRVRRAARSRRGRDPPAQGRPDDQRHELLP